MYSWYGGTKIPRTVIKEPKSTASVYLSSLPDKLKIEVRPFLLGLKVSKNGVVEDAEADPSAYLCLSKLTTVKALKRLAFQKLQFPLACLPSPCLSGSPLYCKMCTAATRVFSMELMLPVVSQVQWIGRPLFISFSFVNRRRVHCGWLSLTSLMRAHDAP